jgi:F-type H+-transporting ATPase subunit epsilon
MTPFPFSILTPGGALMDGEAVFVGVRTAEGALGVLAGHAPLIAACPPGVVRVQRADQGWTYFATSASLLSTDGKTVAVLAGRAAPADDEDAAGRIAREWERETAASELDDVDVPIRPLAETPG